MMKVTKNVLIVDDHPLIIDGYRRAFDHLGQEGKYSFNISDARNCDDGHTLVKRYKSLKEPLHLVFLDIKLPPSRDGLILSGEDLGLKIKQALPLTKILVSTTFNNPYRLHNIMASLDPDALLVKSDLTPKELVRAILTVIKYPPYYTKTVLQVLRKTVNSDIILDEIDRRLLYELSIGTLTKDIPEIINLSLAGVEKRKRHLKQVFHAEGNGSSDKKLLLTVKEKGFI